MDITGKRLLVIGGSMATYAIVQNAQEMGVHVIVADASDSGPAYKLADEGVKISTADIDALAKFVEENRIDGVFCGPSEFNIQNTMKLCEKTGLRFYATKELWDRCGNKQSLKDYCGRNDLPLIPEYRFDRVEQIDECPEDIFPVIVKPVDGCSSKGISVCTDKTQLKAAVSAALEFSQAGKVIVEKFIENGGRQFSFRYFLDEGKCYPYLLMDIYIADPVNRKSLISAFAYAPSEMAEEYMAHTDRKVRNMLCDMGLMHGLAFAQSLPSDGNFYIHDMGYRLSGGMTYQISQTLTGINDMKCMIRYALGGPICTQEELERINPMPKNGVVGQLMIPINAGTIAEIKGVEEIKAEPAVISFLQNYVVGDTIPESAMGTLGQQFARIAVKTDNKAELISIINRLQDGLSIKDTNGNEMYTMRFDTDRLGK